jgi:hypothetical protein
MIRVVALPLMALAAVGCHSGERPEPVPGVQCNANGLEKLIGQPRSAAAEVEAKRISGANVVRWLTPDMMVTMEFKPDRLNLHLNAEGKIASTRCG